MLLKLLVTIIQKSETDSKISQTRESIELGISQTMKQKKIQV